MIDIVDMLDNSNVLDASTADRFRRTGHFVYESGDHGDTWLELDVLFVDTRQSRRLARQLAGKLKLHAPDIICGPLVGGALLGQWVASELDLPFVSATSQAHAGALPSYAIPPVLRQIMQGKRIAIVDDAINLGAATLACVREIEQWGGVVDTVGAVLVREPDVPELCTAHGLHLEYLYAARWHTWVSEACPLCHSGMPIESPN